MVNSKVKCFVTAALIVTLILLPLLYGVTYREPIEKATYIELRKIDDIGDTLAIRVLNYISTHETLSVDDLINVEGIGEERLKAIKEVYK